MGATHMIFQVIQEVSELGTSLNLRFQSSLGDKIFPAWKTGVHLKCIKKRINFH